MAKDIQVKYRTFDENGLETIRERTVCRVYVLTIPTLDGDDDDYLVLGTGQKTEYLGNEPILSVMVPPDNLNFLFLNPTIYKTAEISYIISVNQQEIKSWQQSFFLTWATLTLRF